MREGIAAATIDAIVDGRRPSTMPADESVVYAFSTAPAPASAVDRLRILAG